MNSNTKATLISTLTNKYPSCLLPPTCTHHTCQGARTANATVVPSAAAEPDLQASDGGGGSGNADTTDDLVDDGDVDQAVAAWVLGLGYEPVSSRCSVFARKFPAVLPSTHQKQQHNGRGKASRLLEIGQLKTRQPRGEDALLQWVLSCNSGLGLGAHCQQTAES